MRRTFLSSCPTVAAALATAALLPLGTASRSLAAPPPIVIPTEDDTAAGGANAAGGGFLTGIARRGQLLGDMGGLRTLLSRYGVTLAIQETSEVLGNVSGGARKGADYDGLTQMLVQLDTLRAFGLYGGTFNTSALQVHGRNLSADNLQTLQTASGIEADRATRLWELWYDQKFLEEDRLDVKIGQQSLDSEFIVSHNALLFVNTSFGWPLVPSVDLPGGGPAYPLSALGVRFQGRPIDSVTILGGVYNGSPAPDNREDPQLENASGTSFPLDGGVLAIAEIQYSYPSLGSMLYADEPDPLSRTYKLGIWYDTEDFADQRLAASGLSLADGLGTARRHSGNYSIYAVADQMVWLDAEEPDRNINLFIRAMGTPESDRNPVVFSLNAGLTFHEPFLHRDDDTFGVGMGYGRVSGALASLDRDTNRLSGVAGPIRGGETYVEVTYQYAVAPWLQLQPDFQYSFNPGGGIADPNNTNRRIGDEAVLGVRTNIVF